MTARCGAVAAGASFAGAFGHHMLMETLRDKAAISAAMVAFPKQQWKEHVIRELNARDDNRLRYSQASTPDIRFFAPSWWSRVKCYFSGTAPPRLVAEMVYPFEHVIAGDSVHSDTAIHHQLHLTEEHVSGLMQSFHFAQNAKASGGAPIDHAFQMDFKQANASVFTTWD
jgi:hypothetical protein